MIRHSTGIVEWVDQLMSPIKQGYLGIGKTNPAHILHVQGISTFTGSAHFDSKMQLLRTLHSGAIQH